MSQIDDSGKIYDVSSLSRIITVLDEQQQQFKLQDQAKASKEWFILASVLVVVAVGTLLILKVKTK